MEVPVFHANSVYPDQMPHSAASNLGLHCLPITLLRGSQLKWVNIWPEDIQDSCLVLMFSFGIMDIFLNAEHTVKSFRLLTVQEIWVIYLNNKTAKWYQQFTLFQ